MLIFQCEPSAGGTANVLAADVRQLKPMGLGCKDIIERKFRITNTISVADIHRKSRMQEPHALAKMLGIGSQVSPPFLTNHPEINILHVGAASLLINDGHCIGWKTSPIWSHLGYLEF